MSLMRDSLRNAGVLAALSSAVLFGIAAPISKLLLPQTGPFLLAGLLYAGSGVSLALFRRVRRLAPVQPSASDVRYVLLSALFGGITAPVLLMYGLSAMPASDASLLLNAEGVLTALLAWIVFRENVDRRIALGMLAIVAGAVVLSWNPSGRGVALAPTLCVLGACLAWAVDNNITRKVSLLDATWLASVKGLVASATNLALAFLLHARWPSVGIVFSALVLGALAYGISLALFVMALRHLGTARTGAYFSVAPFIGAILAVTWLGEPVTIQLGMAFVLMALGVWLHLTERHEHQHVHQPLVHDHDHSHDEHHQHTHPDPVAPGVSHRHRHEHAPLRHSHPHFPDAHHRHDHDESGKPPE